MRTANLILHCGSQLATREQIENASAHTPKPTATWCPIAHHEFLNGVESTLVRNGMTIISQAHGLSRDAHRYFGLLQVANGDNAEEFGLVIGIRNSNDRTFPAGLVVGASIFVCDNLSFSGEIRLARKHTINIGRDLPQLIDRAVGRLGDLRRNQEARFAAYRSHQVTDREAHDLIVRSLDARIIPVTHVPHVLKEWRTPRHPEFAERTAFSLFNGFTEVLKGRLDALPARTTALHGLLDSFRFPLPTRFFFSHMPHEPTLLAEILIEVFRQMDPSACLKRTLEAIDAGDVDEARLALDDYRAWRARGGFEPVDGDRRADELEQLLLTCLQPPTKA